MADKIRLTVDKDVLTIAGDKDSLVAQIIAGTKGKIKINTPVFKREFHKLKDSKGKVLRDDKNPLNVGKIEK